MKAPISTASKLGMIGCGGIVCIILILVISVGNTNNNLVGLEEGIVASYNDSENIHSNTLKKIKQAGFVTDNYSTKVQETVSAAIRGRYGDGGVRAGMVWIKEENPEISPALFERMLVIIEAGNNQFAAKQTDRLDRVRVYRTELRSFPQNLTASFLGFPKIDMNKYTKVISVKGSKEAVETGVDAAVNPFGENK